MDICDAILNGSEPALLDLTLLSPLKPLTLLSKRLSELAPMLNSSNISIELLGVLNKVHQNTLNFEAEMCNSKSPVDRTSACQGGDVRKLPFSTHGGEGLYSSDLGSKPERADFFHVACCCAADINLRSLGQMIPFSSDSNQQLVLQLHYSISQLNESRWRETEPRIYLWLCFTGAAAAQSNKAWFFSKAGPVVTSLSADELKCFKLSIWRFCRLLQYLKDLAM